MAAAEPGCVHPNARNFVLASGATFMADSFRSQWWLQGVNSPERILLRSCSEGVDNTCYYAIDVKPGMYYFQQVIPGANDDLTYPVSAPSFWFPITGLGIDYIGHWNIDRTANRAVSKLQIHYELSELEKMIALCKIGNKKIYLDRVKELAHEIVN
jgi:hypothetical protein